MFATKIPNTPEQDVAGLLEIAISYVSDYIELDDNEVDLDALSSAIFAMGRAINFLQPDKATHPSVQLDASGTPICECGEIGNWSEVGRTDYARSFDNESWKESRVDATWNVPEAIVCRRCRRTFNPGTFPRPSYRPETEDK